MSRKQYNSAADRKWQQRYQRIQARKDDALDIETPRDERRRQKRTLYAASRLNIGRIVESKVAVVCKNEGQVRQVYSRIAQEYPQYTRWVFSDAIPNAYSLFKENTAMAIVTEDSWFGNETFIKFDAKSSFQRMGFEIIEFYDLLPVIDLGKVCESSESVEFLLGL